MNPASHPDDEEAKLLRYTLYWGAATVIAAWGLWRVGDPWLLEHFGSGAPWWAYLLLCAKFAAGILRLLADDAAHSRAARDHGLLRADDARRRRAAAGSGWQGSRFGPSAGAEAAEFQVTSGTMSSR